MSFHADGTRLAGMLHPPATGPLRGIGLVMVPGGLTRRVGLHRLFTTAARAFAALGASVLRFDLPGVGESEGEVRWFTRARLASLEARYLAEVRAALDCLDRHAAPGIHLLLGHCNGARSAVATAAAEPRAEGVLAWGMPTGTDEGTSPAPWIRDALETLLDQKTPSLFVYGANDPAWPDFRGFTGEVGPPRREWMRERWMIHVIETANHDFTAADWTRDVIDTSIAWMRARWGPAS